MTSPVFQREAASVSDIWFNPNVASWSTIDHIAVHNKNYDSHTKCGREEIDNGHIGTDHALVWSTFEMTWKAAICKRSSTAKLDQAKMSDLAQVSSFRPSLAFIQLPSWNTPYAKATQSTNEKVLQAAADALQQDNSLQEPTVIHCYRLAS